MGRRARLESQRSSRWLARQVTAAACVAIVLAGCGGGDSSTADDASTIVDTTPVPAETVAVTETPPSTTPIPTLDGHLMFSRFDESTHTFLSTHITAADGSGEVELTLPGPEGGGRWSHAGTEIAVSTVLDDGRIGTAIITPDGVVERVLTIADPTLNLPCIFWSPDDSHLACEGWDDADPSRTGIYIVSAADGSDLVRLTTPPEGLADRPGDFTPDGTKLLFKRAHEEDPGPLFLTDAAQEAEPQAFGTDDVEDPGRFSPDGQFVATSIDGHVAVLGADGNVQNTINESGRYLFGPSWSPTGEWLAYSSTPVGEFAADLYINHPDGSDPHQITDTPDNEIVVDWGKA